MSLTEGTAHHEAYSIEGGHGEEIQYNQDGWNKHPQTLSDNDTQTYPDTEEMEFVEDVRKHMLLAAEYGPTESTKRVLRSARLGHLATSGTW